MRDGQRARAVARRAGCPTWLTLTRAPEMPCVRCRRRSAISPALSSRTSQRFSGMITMPVFTSALRPKPPRAHVDAPRIAVLHLVHGDGLDLAQLPVEVLDAGALGRGDEDADHARGPPAARARSECAARRTAIPITNSTTQHAEQRQRTADDPHRLAARAGRGAEPRRSGRRDCGTARSMPPAMRERGMPLANNLDAIMGVRLSATNAEKPTAAATVTPNSPNNRPGIAGHERHGHEHRHEHQRGGDHGEADFPRAADRGQHGVLAAFDAPHDVLEHHDGVVDHQADGQHRGQQRQRVDRIIERHHDDGRGDDGHRNRDRGNQRGAQRAEEQEDHDQHQDQRLGQRRTPRS